jgi:hypothetical protein
MSVRLYVLSPHDFNAVESGSDRQDHRVDFYGLRCDHTGHGGGFRNQLRFYRSGNGQPIGAYFVRYDGVSGVVTTTRTGEPVVAAVGLLAAAPPQFQAACDLPKGGVLLALPALLAVGLLRHTTALYALPNGF